MCRLFGFRSVIPSQVHSSLVSAENALMRQSSMHPDGWGVAYYIHEAPHVIKSVSSAVEDNLFKRVSGVVSSETVIAHLRKATVGSLNSINTHPFQYGKWIFAHNGNVKSFAQNRRELLHLITPHYRRFILGETDSEMLFYIILSHLTAIAPIHSHQYTLKTIAQAIETALTEITKVIGPVHDSDEGDPKENYMTFLLTDGSSMVGFAGGKHLYYSTYKKKCSERETCPSFAPECESPTQTGFVNHLIFSSEPLQGENIWHQIPTGTMVGVDHRMHLTETQIPLMIKP